MSQTPYGSVKPNGDKWVARIQVGGDRTQRTFESERAAWNWVRANREIAATEPTTKAPPTLLDVGKTWFDDREKSGRVRHVRQERSAWRAHVETWQDAHRPLRSLTRRHVHDFVGSLGSRAKVSRQTVKHVLRLVRQVVAHAHDTGVISADPIATLRVPRAAHVSASDAWTWLRPDEIAAVLAACRGVEQRALVTVAIYTGLRKGELWQLRWSAVHLDGPSPELHVRGKLKSSHAERSVPLLPPALDALRALKAHRKAEVDAAQKEGRAEVVQLDPLVWPSPSGGVRRADDDAAWASKRWRAAKGEPLRLTEGVAARAGIKRRVRFHDLRHTCASHLVQGTWGPAMRLEDVRQWMGHSSITVTTRYAHLSPTGLRGKALAMAAHMRPEALNGRAGSGSEVAGGGEATKATKTETP